MQTGDGKTRRRQRDSSSPTIRGEPSAVSAIPLSNDANRRLGIPTSSDQSRRNSISDKGRLGEEGPYKDGEFVVYSSGTDSGSEEVGSPSRAPMSRNVLPAASKATSQDSRRSDEYKAAMQMERDMGVRSDRVRDKEREREKDKVHESNAEGWERDGKGWVPKDQDAVRSKASSNVSAPSSSRGGGSGQAQGRPEKDNFDATNNDDVRCVCKAFSYAFMFEY